MSVIHESLSVIHESLLPLFDTTWSYDAKKAKRENARRPAFGPAPVPCID